MMRWQKRLKERGSARSFDDLMIHAMTFARLKIFAFRFISLSAAFFFCARARADDLRLR